MELNFKYHFYAVLPLLLGMTPMTMAQNNSVFLLYCDFKPKSRISVVLKSDEGPHTHIEVKHMILKTKGEWQTKQTFHVPLAHSFLNEMSNGTVWSVPYGRHWYTFQDLTSSKNQRFVSIEIRSRKTGKMVEWIECHDPENSSLNQLIPNHAPLGKEIIPLMNKELSEWFYRISQ